MQDLIPDVIREVFKVGNDLARHRYLFAGSWICELDYEIWYSTSRPIPQGIEIRFTSNAAFIHPQLNRPEKLLSHNVLPEWQLLVLYFSHRMIITEDP
jgi:hypothetical protein